MILPSDSASGDPAARAKFPMGQLVATPAALDTLTSADITTALRRHLSGDWGDLCPEDREENEQALRKGYRLFSVYQSASGTRFWIITEHDRSVTTILLPSDY